MRSMAVLLLAGALASSTTSATQVFRCVGEQGEPEYRQAPCATVGQVAAGRYPATREAAAPGLRASERAWLAGRDRRKPGKPISGRQVLRDRSGSAAQRTRQNHGCVRKRRQLDELNADMRRGYRAGRGEKLRRRRRAYEDYLAAFCP